MDVMLELQVCVQENMANDVLCCMWNEVVLDGRENVDFYLWQQFCDFYYIGQQLLMNIFNLIVWKWFFDFWKVGDFKKKD